MIAASLQEAAPPMSQNDLIHLDAAYKNWVATRGQGLSEDIDPFLFYTLDQFLKPFDLTDEELLSGVTDGQLDGGIDALYFLVDRELVRDDTELDPKTAQSVDLILFNIKNRDEGFKPTEVDKAVFFADDLLDLSKDVRVMNSTYRPEVISLMALFHEKYPRVASAFPKTRVTINYITRADGSTVNPSAKVSAQRVKEKVLEHLSKAEFSFNFINAQGLLDQIQVRRPSARVLKWADSPSQTTDGQVGFVALRDYYDFIVDGDQLDRPIFESNVRGWQGDSQVNKQIRASLASSPINFWLLNNGITILAREFGAAGSKQLTLRDPRVVNGLQTSRAIYDYFRNASPPAGDDRTILVRVIQTTDPAVFDAVVRATNSQNRMPPASLRATDLIHRQIEALFEQFDLYYDRRKGVHKDEGKPVAKIVAVSEVLQAVVAIMLQRPDDARARPGIYLGRDEKYNQVFGQDAFNLNVYLNCAKLMRRVDAYLLGRSEVSRGDRRNIRFYVAALLACDISNSYPPSPESIAGLDVAKVTDHDFERAFFTAWLKFKKLGPIDATAKGTVLVKKLVTDLKRKLSRAAAARVRVKAR